MSSPTNSSITPPTSVSQLATSIQRISSKMRITKIAATRSIRGQGGDTFLGFSAAFESVQDDGLGAGVDLISVVSPEDISSGGLTLEEAKVAQLILGCQVDLGVLEAARANGNLSEDNYNQRKKAVRDNYKILLRGKMSNE